MIMSFLTVKLHIMMCRLNHSSVDVWLKNYSVISLALENKFAVIFDIALSS